MESTEGTRARRAVPLRATERRGVPRLIEVLCTGPDGYQRSQLTARHRAHLGRARTTLAAIARHNRARQLMRYRALPTAPWRELPATPVLAGLPRAAAQPPGFRRVMQQPAGAVPSARSGRRRQR